MLKSRKDIETARVSSGGSVGLLKTRKNVYNYLATGACTTRAFRFRLGRRFV